ncbi:ATP synthase subunit delta [BD1-7 clade bacterium]|uniref:ATP synthase subunit delta n=1 Tax=BD1-7 clade bacterium TaxID=2029982 RepID=A0A5S9QED5_9GAMM|nr:ATP synthase subunit delta [BD1-7 clade bacterium]CAA0083152.1 ATP synthase subunit delta [BD1-7 clade bacterium]CAA0116727.1 ATP synthase subunit delta [BD1-7 clade bacterium]
MAELSTLARPYAKAAFGFALANQNLDAWAKMLNTLAAIVSNDKVDAILSSPALTSEQQVTAITAICGDELTEECKNFVSLLAENKRLTLLKEVTEQFVSLKAQHEKFCDVEVTSAYDVDSEVEENLAKALSNKLNCSVNIQTTVDKDLIGGVVIRAGDLVIDSSVRGRLAKLTEAMSL